VDLAVLGVLGVSALLAFMRGLVREVLGIGAWVGAIAAAFEGLPLTRPIVRNWMTAPEWVDPIAFASVFLISLIVLSLIARVIGRQVRGSALGGLDRTLGLVFGVARGAALVIIAYIIGGWAVPVERWPDPVLEARSLGPAFEGAKWAARQLPENYQPHVNPPPAGRQTSAEALLHALPQGTATGRTAGRQPVRD